MGLRQLIVPFYERLPAGSFRVGPVPGQIGWIVAPIPDPVPRVLLLKRDGDRTHDRVEGEIRNMIIDDFKKGNELPVFRMRLRKNEACLVQRSKRRPAIVVGLYGSRFDDVDKLLRQAGKKHLQEQNIVAAPIYGNQSEDHPDGFPPVMQSRIAALMYSQFFPCPQNNDPFLMGGAARLDRLQTIVPQAPSWEPTDVRLVPEAMSVLLGLLRLRFGSTSESEIEALRDLLKDCIPPEHQAATEVLVSGS
jgi:hypothetical protein